MSTGAEFHIATDGTRWAYRIQNWPYGEWPDYTYHGPFSSMDALVRHRNQNYANPGGASLMEITVEEMDEFLKNVVREPKWRPRRW